MSHNVRDSDLLRSQMNNIEAGGSRGAGDGAGGDGARAILEWANSPTLCRQIVVERSRQAPCAVAAPELSNTTA